MRPIIFSLSCLVLSLVSVGCGDASRPSADVAPVATTGESATAALSTAPYSEGGSMKPFYGEIFHNGRYYLFGTKAEFVKFSESHEVNPLICKNFIGKGPNRETVIAQSPKESPSMPARLVNQLRKRHNLPPME